MKSLQQQFQVQFQYPVHFTQNLFQVDNSLFISTLPANPTTPHKVFFLIDSGVAEAHPHLSEQITTYAASHASLFQLFCPPVLIPGGETCKNTSEWTDKIVQWVEEYRIDRQSFITVIGGGAVLDMAGFAAAISHRGIRLIRIPTTVLAQNDSGIGVKNSVNFFGKKNFLGTFAPPFAVLNDFTFLQTLSDRDWRSGTAEAIKVALVKDASFFEFLEQHATLLTLRHNNTMQQLIYRCAELHLAHIASGDPFELGSSRPLDFGHWAAHKLESLTRHEIRHGEAVAIGMALDCVYSHLIGLLASDDLERILSLLQRLGFELYSPCLIAHDAVTKSLFVLQGLEEFREHLGGKLTIMLLKTIGTGVEVHTIQTDVLIQSVHWLKERSLQNTIN